MTSPRRLTTVSVADAATNQLRESLFAGEYEAGQEIKDTQVAEAFGIARPTARVAVQQLINEGMLVRLPGYSARVRTFDPPQVQDLFRVRRLIELDAVREVQQTGPSLELIAEALGGFSRLQRREDDWTKIAAADVAFHSAVVATAESQHLRTFFSAIASEVRLLIGLLKSQYAGGEALYREHEELYRLLASDASLPEVEEAWLAHLNSAEEFLVQHLS